ncbi:MAG: hypothetical protein ACYC43_12220, partial [Burkholderiales bacterium]
VRSRWTQQHFLKNKRKADISTWQKSGHSYLALTGFAQQTLKLLPDFIDDATRLESALRNRYPQGQENA